MAVPRTAETASAGADSNAGGKGSFDQAFDKAVDQHAAGGEGDTTDGDTKTEQTSEDTDEEAGRSDETSEGSDQETQESQDTKGAEGDEADDDTAEAATEEEAALIAQLPPALRKQWNRVFTHKTQSIAADTRLIRALRANPEAAARRILETIETSRKASETADDETPPITKEALRDKFLKIKGVNAEQAESLASIMVESLDAAVAPIRARQEQDAIQADADLVDAALTAFQKDHPEFDEIEPQMSALMDELPKGNVSYRKYLDHIHAIVMQDKTVAARVKNITEKIKKNAVAAGTKARSVPSAAVKAGRSGRLPTFEESAAAAERGETWGKGISR